jgi:glycine cleavage system transcriptional repressor
MRRNLVLTLTGSDRIGLVETVTKLLFEHGGNVETSRMARLGGEFAMLMLVSMPSDRMDALDRDLNHLAAQGFKATAVPTVQTYAEKYPGWLPYRVEVHGADHEGIIHEVAHDLSSRGINIETMDTETTRAPISGTPLFTMKAMVMVPPALAGQDWKSALGKVGNRLNVDIHVSAVDK